MSIRKIFKFTTFTKICSGKKHRYESQNGEKPPKWAVKMAQDMVKSAEDMVKTAEQMKAETEEILNELKEAGK